MWRANIYVVGMVKMTRQFQCMCFSAKQKRSKEKLENNFQENTPPVGCSHQEMFVTQTTVSFESVGATLCLQTTNLYTPAA